MMSRILLLLIGILVSFQIYAFPCFITMVKDSCWTKYNVTVDVFNASSDKPVAKVIIPAGTSWAREEFSCEPQEKLGFRAQFTPVFWEQDAGKTYDAQHYWTLPEKISQDETAWNLTICYPAEFSAVPFPPEGSGNCKCDKASIPPVEPQ